MVTPDSAGRRACRLRAATLLLGALASVCIVLPDALAADRPVTGRTLRLQRAGDQTRMLLSSRDATFPFPDVGSADDPATGTPGGMLVEVLARSAAAQRLSVPPGLGNPGWRIAGRATAFVYRSRDDVRSAVLSRGRLFQVHAANVGVPLLAPLGAVAIRVTTGALRSCAVFDGASVRRDRPGLFSAQNAAAPALADCSDESLRAALGDSCAASAWPECGGPCSDGGVCAPEPTGGGCRCVSPTQPCGETAPLCSGQCPAGEQCWPIDGLIPGDVNGCLCAPVGEPPCGTTGICNGACPDGLACEVIPGSGIYDSFCACNDPDAICGSPGYGACPADMDCLLMPGVGYQCFPILCGGTFPTCGGGCTGGRACVPLQVSSSTLCVCATPGSSCEGPACGGLSCDGGDVCTVDVSGGATTCSCLPP